jgi:hypothetical protein
MRGEEHGKEGRKRQEEREVKADTLACELTSLRTKMLSTKFV